jgi:hypothetical protein
MFRALDIYRLWIRNFILLCLIVGASVVSITPRLAAKGDEVFLNIKTWGDYMIIMTGFDIKEGTIDDGSEIEVLRADTKEGSYEVIGSLNYKAGQNSYVFQDKTVKKARYSYKLRVKGRDITSEPFSGRALVRPPGT